VVIENEWFSLVQFKIHSIEEVVAFLDAVAVLVDVKSLCHTRHIESFGGVFQVTLCLHTFIEPLRDLTSKFYDANDYCWEECKFKNGVLSLYVFNQLPSQCPSTAKFESIFRSNGSFFFPFRNDANQELISKKEFISQHELAMVDSDLEFIVLPCKDTSADLQKPNVMLLKKEQKAPKLAAFEIEKTALFKQSILTAIEYMKRFICDRSKDDGKLVHNLWFRFTNQAPFHTTLIRRYHDTFEDCKKEYNIVTVFKTVDLILFQTKDTIPTNQKIFFESKMNDFDYPRADEKMPPAICIPYMKSKGGCKALSFRQLCPLFGIDPVNGTTQFYCRSNEEKSTSTLLCALSGVKSTQDDECKHLVSAGNKFGDFKHVHPNACYTFHFGLFIFNVFQFIYPLKAPNEHLRECGFENLRRMFSSTLAAFETDTFKTYTDKKKPWPSRLYTFDECVSFRIADAHQQRLEKQYEPLGLMHTVKDSLVDSAREADLSDSLREKTLINAVARTHNAVLLSCGFEYFPLERKYKRWMNPLTRSMPGKIPAVRIHQSLTLFKIE